MSKPNTQGECMMCGGDTYSKPDADGDRVCGRCCDKYECMVKIVRKVLKQERQG